MVTGREKRDGFAGKVCHLLSILQIDGNVSLSSVRCWNVPLHSSSDDQEFLALGLVRRRGKKGTESVFSGQMTISIPSLRMLLLPCLSP